LKREPGAIAGARKTVLHAPKLNESTGAVGRRYTYIAFNITSTDKPAFSIN